MAKSAQKPNYRCPFTGKTIEVVQVGGGLCWMGRGPGWSTKLFGSEEELVYFLSTRGGVKPAFPKKTKISVRTLEPPAPDHMADIKEKGRLLDEKIPSIVTGICDQFNARNK